MTGALSINIQDKKEVAKYIYEECAVYYGKYCGSFVFSSVYFYYQPRQKKNIDFIV